MKTVWERSPVSTGEIVKDLESTVNWKYKTYHSLIRRLTDKKALGYVTEHGVRQYYPLVSQSECIVSESQSFLKKIFDGSVHSMLTCFVEQKLISENDIERLRKLLQDKAKD